MQVIKWTKWVTEYSAGSLPTYVRRGTTVDSIPIEIYATRAEERSQFWHIGIKIDGRLVKQRGLVRHETKRDVQEDLTQNAEMLIEDRQK